MKKTSIDALAISSMRQAQSEAAMAQRELRALRDSLSAMSRSARTPVIRPKRTTIKGSTSGSNLAGFLGIGTALLIDAGLFGDTDIKAGGKVNIGGVAFGYSAGTRQGSSGYDDGDNGSASAAQSAGALYAVLSAAQRVR